MKTKAETKDQKTVLTLEGKIDGKTAPELQETILPYIVKNSRILLDMTQVSYLSSAGLRVLLAIYRKAKQEQAEFVLVGLSENIKDIMFITGFLKHFNIIDTKEAGLQWLEKGM